MLIPVAYIAFGLFTISMYYSAYDFNVLKYLDLTELVTVWFPYSSYCLFFFGLAVFGVWMLRTAKAIDRHHYYYLLFNFGPVAIWIHLLLRYFVNINNLPKDTLDLLRHSLNFLFPFIACFLCMFSLLQGTYLTIKSYLKKPPTESNETYLSLTTGIGIFLILFFVITIPILETQAISYHTPSDTTTVYTKTDTITSNEDLLVVGQTKNYIFFYRKSTEAPKIVALREVTRIEETPVGEWKSR